MRRRNAIAIVDRIPIMPDPKVLEQMRKDLERAVRAGKISPTEAKKFIQFYESGLNGYTYLEEP